MTERASRNVVWYWWSGSVFIGLILILVGGFYLAKDMGWIPQNFPFWPLILIFLGLVFIAGSIRKVSQY